MSVAKNCSKHSSSRLHMASRRLDADDVIDMLSDVDTDAESEDEIGGPICPGSDELPIPDSDDGSPKYDSDR